MKPVTPRAYLTSFFTFALFGLALVAALGLAVDGFGVFGTRLIGAYHFPPNLRLSISGDRVTKAIEIAEREGDEVFFVGNSRTQHGLDPDAPALSGVKAYNAALAGASLREQIVALDYALAHEPGIRHVVWGLSLEEFPFAIATSGDYAIRPSQAAASPPAFCATSSLSIGSEQASRRSSRPPAMCAPR